MEHAPRTFRGRRPNRLQRDRLQRDRFQRGVGAREATGGETTLDVMEVGFDGKGVLLSLRVYTEALTGCPDRATVVVKSTGEELARTEIPLESDYPFFGLVSVETPCVGRGRVRLPQATRETALQFEVLFGGEVYATGGDYLVGDLARQPPPPAPDPGGPVESAVSSAIQPLITGAVTIGGGYFLLTNLDTISEAFSD